MSDGSVVHLTPGKVLSPRCWPSVTVCPSIISIDMNPIISRELTVRGIRHFFG
jgi:hypothetical protein